jgi:MarR family transcriptional regulator for hemolysin
MISSNPQRALIERTLKIVRDLRAMFDCRAKSLGLTYARARALAVIARMEGATQRELAEELEIETPSLKRLLDGLEGSGFIARTAADGDRRANNVHLTDMARGQADAILRFMDDVRGQVFADISPEELEIAQRVLDQMGQNIGRMRRA